MHADGWFLLVILALVIMIVAPVASLVLVWKLRREQQRQGQILDLLMERREKAGPTVSTETKPEPLAHAFGVEGAPPPKAVMPAFEERRAVAPSTPGHPTPPIPHPVAPEEKAPPPLPPLPDVSTEQISPPAPTPEPGEWQLKATDILGKIWNWIVIGEEYRKPGVPWEFAVATNWLLRLGIVALVVGVGFFLKYSIEHGLLGPEARVALSVLTGLAMLAGGVRLMGKPYQLLGQGLMGGGLAILYFAMFAACNFYHLIGVLAAFGLMALVTLVAGTLAVRLNSLLVAVLGILGGYGTPIMLNTGVKNFPGLFGYLLLLGLGVLGIAHRRHWPLLNYLGLILTYGLATASIARQYEPSDLPVVLPFLVAFFALYAAVMFIHNLLHRQQATLLELLGIMANAFLCFGLGHRVITLAHPERHAAFLALGIAAFFILLVQFFLARRHQDRGLLLTFLALAALFIALVPPLAFSRQWVTASWAFQGVAMLWLAGRLDSRFLRLLGGIACLLAAGRLGIVDFHQQFAHPLPPELPWTDYLVILGQRLLAMGAPLAAFGAAWALLRRPAPAGAVTVAPENDLADSDWQQTTPTFLAVIGCGLLFVYAQLELHHTCGFFWPALAVPATTLAWFGLGLFLITLFRKTESAWILGLLMTVSLGIVLKLLFVDMDGWDLNASTWLYGSGYDFALALLRLGDFALCIGLLALMFFRAKRPALPAGIAALVLLFVYLTLEANTAMARFLPGLRAGGITLLWAAYALTLLLFGLARQVAGLRYASLILFTVVVGKIFLVDLAHLEALYKIVAFILLGGILLGAALVYLKYRERFAPDHEGDTP